MQSYFKVIHHRAVGEVCTLIKKNFSVVADDSGYAGVVEYFFCIAVGSLSHSDGYMGSPLGEQRGQPHQHITNILLSSRSEPRRIVITPHCEGEVIIHHNDVVVVCSVLHYPFSCGGDAGDAIWGANG